MPTGSLSGGMDVYQQSKTPELFRDTISLIVLATIAVGARLAARRISVAGLWWDDYVIVLALVRCSTDRSRSSLILARSSTGASAPAIGCRSDTLSWVAIRWPMVDLYNKAIYSPSSR